MNEKLDHFIPGGVAARSRQSALRVAARGSAGAPPGCYAVQQPTSAGQG